MQLILLPTSINWNGYQVTDKQDQTNSQWCQNLQQHHMGLQHASATEAMPAP